MEPENVFEHFASVTGLDQLNVSPLAILTTLLLPIIALLVLALSQTPTTLLPPAGCRKLGLKGRSNLDDQYSKKYAKGADATPAKPWTVKALFVYPLKSCAPVELDTTEILRSGLKYDRQFCLGQYVTSLPSLQGEVTSEWHFMTLRKFPRLAKVETEIWVPDPSAPGYSANGEWVKSEGCVVVRFPFSPDTDFTVEGLKNYGKILAAKLARKTEPTLEFTIPFNPSKERIKSKGYRNEVMRIWHDSPVALDLTSEVDPEVFAKLRYTLGAANPIALFRIDSNNHREVHKNAPKKVDVGFQTTVAMHDDHPVNILNLASVHDVASKMILQPKSKHHWQNHLTLLNALRFRANIYLTGPPAFHEDDWTKARISSPGSSDSLDLHIACRTTRCKLPNVDPETGIADRNEPLSTLRSYRIIDKGQKSPVLGMQVVPLEKGSVSVGDVIDVLATGEHSRLNVEGPQVEG